MLKKDDNKNKTELVNKNLPKKDDIYILDTSKSIDRSAWHLLKCLLKTKKADGEYMNMGEFADGYRELSNIVRNVHETPKNITPIKEKNKHK